jgi:AcrR family transcriptional regulator
LSISPPRPYNLNTVQIAYGIYVNTVKMKRPSAKPRRAAYHHGDLRHQMMVATEEIILERGVEGFTLREAARRAGVSPAAPAHHFKDAKGLLTEVALLGFREFGAALEAADKLGGTDPAIRLREQARAYVRFALAQPARFQLMFRHDKHDKTNEEFQRVARHSYGVLEGAVRAATRTPQEQPLSPSARGFLLANWSIVHGFAQLALGGELGGPEGSSGVSDDSLLTLMLEHLPAIPPG